MIRAFASWLRSVEPAAAEEITVRGKLDRQRLVPVHPSTAAELRAYRDGRTSGPLLVGRSGQRRRLAVA